MSDIQVENCQENLSLYLEHDSGYHSQWRKDHQAVDEEIGHIVLVFNGGENFDGIEKRLVYEIIVDYF